MGPPPVVIQMRGNTCMVQMKSSMAMLMMIGKRIHQFVTAIALLGVAVLTMGARCDVDVEYDGHYNAARICVPGGNECRAQVSFRPIGNTLLQD